MHSSDTIHGWRFNELPNGDVKYSEAEYKDSDCSIGFPHEEPKNPSTIFAFISALNEGERLENSQVPISTLGNWSFERAQNFFAEYPDLIPDRIESPNEDGQRSNNNLLFYAVAGFVALCIVSVIAYQFMQNESQTLETAQT